MFDPESLSAAAPTPPRRAKLHNAWWILGLAGVGALLLALRVGPAPQEPAPPAHAAAVAREIAPPEPETVSLPATAGKACAGLLLVYGAGWGLVRLRRRGWTPGSRAACPEAARPRLEVAETLPLGHQRACLHLVEVDGTTLLLGSVMDQVCLLWTAAADRTSAFAPVPPAVPEPPVEAPPRPLIAPPPTRPVARHEAEWTRERSRLISALLNQDDGH